MGQISVSLGTLVWEEQKPAKNMKSCSASGLGQEKKPINEIGRMHCGHAEGEQGNTQGQGRAGQRGPYVVREVTGQGPLHVVIWRSPAFSQFTVNWRVPVGCRHGTVRTRGSGATQTLLIATSVV
jgi:hypothetical protein